jgi:hypothetical protein
MQAMQYGHVVVIRRSGKDGGRFPLTGDALFGRGLDCHVRIQLNTVSRKHMRLTVDDDGAVLLKNLSATNGTFYAGKPLSHLETVKLGNGDEFMIGARRFRWEYNSDLKWSMVNSFVKRSIKGKKAGNAQPISDENAAPNSKSSTPKAVKSVTPKRKSSVKKQRSAKKSIIEEIPHTDFIGHASPCAMDMEEDEIVEESAEDGEEEEMPRQAMPTPVRKSIEALRKATPKKSAKKSAKKRSDNYSKRRQKENSNN